MTKNRGVVLNDFPATDAELESQFSLEKGMIEKYRTGEIEIPTALVVKLTRLKIRLEKQKKVAPTEKTPHAAEEPKVPLTPETPPVPEETEITEELNTPPTEELITPPAEELITPVIPETPPAAEEAPAPEVPTIPFTPATPSSYMGPAKRPQVPDFL